MSSPAKMQTVGEATSSIKGVFQSTFSSLANSLSLPQLRDSFFQNIIYILIVIVILIGILVYIQMVGTSGVNPLSLPPTKEVRKIEIQKVVEGFDVAYTFCGWCWVVKADVRDWLFPLDEQFSFYFNDNDIAMHLKERGCKHAMVAASLVEHYGQRSLKVLHDRGVYHEVTFGLEKNFNNKWKHLFQS